MTDRCIQARPSVRMAGPSFLDETGLSGVYYCLLYTSAAVNAAKAKMGSVTAVQKERMEAQFQYWNNAKALV